MTEKGNDHYSMIYIYSTHRPMNQSVWKRHHRLRVRVILWLTASQSWNWTPVWALQPDFYYCQTVAGLLMWGTLSDERTGLSFTIASGFVSAVIFRSESHGTRNHILLSQIRDFPFLHLLWLAGLRWRYATPPPYGREAPINPIIRTRTHHYHRAYPPPRDIFGVITLNDWCAYIYNLSFPTFILMMGGGGI
jgi:hypothetical protein